MVVILYDLLIKMNTHCRVMATDANVQGEDPKCKKVSGVFTETVICFYGPCVYCSHFGSVASV